MNKIKDYAIKKWAERAFKDWWEEFNLKEDEGYFSINDMEWIAELAFEAGFIEREEQQ